MESGEDCCFVLGNLWPCCHDCLLNFQHYTYLSVIIQNIDFFLASIDYCSSIASNLNGVIKSVLSTSLYDAKLLLGSTCQH